MARSLTKEQYASLQEAGAMDVVAELRALKCDPGPVHSPNECDNPQPCPCVVQAAAVDEILRLRRKCGEAVLAEREACAKVVEGMKMQEILLAAGEMTAQERRTVRALQTWLAHKIRTQKDF